MSVLNSLKRNMPKWFLFLLILSATDSFGQEQVRVKDIVTIQGVRRNQLVGLGLVAGVSGRGDSQSSVITRRSLSNLVSEFGIEVPADDIRSKNVAVVTVTADIDGFGSVGDRVDVSVSSIGDATDLGGGMLLQTPLRGANGTDYAVAQGRVLSPGTGDSAATVGTVPGGAIVEREVPSDYSQAGSILLILNRPDFTTAVRITDTIVAALPELSARAVHASVVEIRFPEEEADPVRLVAAIEQLTLVPDTPAKVVVEQESGVVVLGGDVRIGPVGISYGGNEVSVRPISIYDDSGQKSFTIDQTASVSDFIAILQQLEVTTDTLIEMLKLIDKAGMLYGVLEVE